MKKIILAVFVAAACLLAGCTTSKSFTYSVETGDSVKVTLNSSGGYDLTSKLPFTVSKDKEAQTMGTFIYSDAYDSYVEAATAQDGAMLLDSGTKDGMEYVFWSYNGAEFNYAIRLNGSNTGIVLGNNVSESSAKDCFNRLSFELDD